jgi:nucleotide-binding universal stress UspA family protein
MPAKATLWVPIDGSDCALRALRYASRRFRQGGYHAIVALNVQMAMSPSALVSRQMIATHQRNMSEEALAPARALAARLKVPLTCQVLDGDPARAIIRSASKARGDEIIMGTRGLGRVGGLLMGSVATKVVQLAPVPVTLIK